MSKGVSINTDTFDRATLLIEQMKDLSCVLLAELEGADSEKVTLAYVLHEKAEEAKALLRA